MEADKALRILEKQVSASIRGERLNYDFLHFLFELNLHLLAKLSKKDSRRDGLFGKMEEIIAHFTSHRAFGIKNLFLLGIFSDKTNPEINLTGDDAGNLHIKTQDIASISSIHNMIARSVFCNHEAVYNKNAMRVSFAWALFNGDFDSAKALILLFCEKHCCDISKDANRINSAALREFISGRGNGFKMAAHGTTVESLQVLNLILQLSKNLGIKQDDFGKNHARAIEDALSNLQTQMLIVNNSHIKIEDLPIEAARILFISGLKIKMLGENGAVPRKIIVQNQDGNFEITDEDVEMTRNMVSMPADETLNKNILRMVLGRIFPDVNKVELEANLRRLEIQTVAETEDARNSTTKAEDDEGAPAPSPVARVDVKVAAEAESEDEWLDATEVDGFDDVPHYEEEMATLRASKAELEAKLVAAETVMRNTKSEVENTKAKAVEAEKNRRAAQSELDKTKAAMKKIQAEIAALRAENKDVKVLERSVAAANKKFEAEKTKAEKSKDQIRDLAAANATLIAQKAKIERDLEDLSVKFEAQKTKSEQQLKKMGDRVAQAGSRESKTAKLLKEERSTAAKKDDAASALKKEVEKLKARNKALEEEAAKVKDLEVELTTARRAAQRVEALEAESKARMFEVKQLRGVAKHAGERLEALRNTAASSVEEASTKVQFEKVKEEYAAAVNRVEALTAENAALRANLETPRERDKVFYSSEGRYFYKEGPRGHEIVDVVGLSEVTEKIKDERALGSEVFAEFRKGQETRSKLIRVVMDPSKARKPTSLEDLNRRYGSLARPRSRSLSDLDTKAVLLSEGGQKDGEARS